MLSSTSPRLHARRLHGGGHLLPQAARGDPLRAPRHSLPPLPSPLPLHPPLRRPRRRQLQPHRRRRLLRRRPHKPLPLLRRALLPGAGRRRSGRRSGNLGADAGQVQTHARGPFAQGGSPHRRRRRIAAHFHHHPGRALDHRQGPPQPHPQDLDDLHHHRLPRSHRRSLHRPFHEPSQCIWVGICEESAQHVGAVLCVLDMPLYWCHSCCLGVQGVFPSTGS